MTVLGIDRVERRNWHTGTFLIGGLLLGSICFLHKSEQQGGTYSTHERLWWIGLVFVTRLCIFSGSILTWIWTAEIWPTAIRSTGHSSSNAAGRVGGFCVPFVIARLSGGSDGTATDSQQWLGWFWISTATIMVLLARWNLPETSLRNNRGVMMGSSAPMQDENILGFRDDEGPTTALTVLEERKIGT